MFFAFFYYFKFFLKYASTSRLSRGDLNQLFRILVANIAKRNTVEKERQRIEEERRQEHRKTKQAMQSLTNTVAEFLTILKQNLHKNIS